MMINETDLSWVSLVTAVILGIPSLLAIIRPGALAERAAGFPRNRVAGMALTAIALLWSAYLINDMTLGELSKYKWLLYVLTPLSYYLTVRYLDELLAARALGGLLMLYPTIMMDAARWHPSSWRLLVVLLGYVMVILGIWIILSPYKFRIWTSWLLAPERTFRTGLVGVIITAALLATAVIAR